MHLTRNLAKITSFRMYRLIFEVSFKKIILVSKSNLSDKNLKIIDLDRCIKDKEKVINELNNKNINGVIKKLAINLDSFLGEKCIFFKGK